ncbi:hypothetical protein LTR02_009104 [Friedmanniomyces endolithicus]|nr:hypothetical protein LTR02_009104 [Friedmanniomyces endolithicus]
MDLLANDGTTIPVNSRSIARCWGQRVTNLLRELLVMAAETDTATLWPSIASHPSRNSSITITPSVTSGATTLTNNNTTSDLPDTRSAPPYTTKVVLPPTHRTDTAFPSTLSVHFDVTVSTITARNTPDFLARPYKIDGLLEAVVERLHESLGGRNAAAIFNAAAMAAGGGEGVQFAPGSGSAGDGTILLRGASLANMDGGA